MSAELVANELLDLVHSLARGGKYPEPVLLRDFVEAALRSLGSEAPDIRPVSSAHEPGGLVEVATAHVVIVPDLHARSSLLIDLLSSISPHGGHSRLLDLILDGRLTVICLGDILHTEGRIGADRWARAARRLSLSHGLDGILGNEMDDEMGASLGALALVMLLKARLGGYFHCLKGNHDNITNTSMNGDSAFYKYALEGAMGAEWFKLRYGGELMKTMRRYERLLPLVARGCTFCASHAEPAFAICMTDLLEYKSRADVVRALIWTGNDEAGEDSVQASLAALLDPAVARSGGFWVSGHRSVQGVYAIRAGGHLVQIHNPERRQVAWIDNPAGEHSSGIAMYEVKEGGAELKFLESLPSFYPS